jgi:hypothetical protein
MLGRFGTNVSAAIHWGEDVDKFKPERFIDTETYKWPRDACTSIDTLINVLTITPSSLHVLSRSEELHWAAFRGNGGGLYCC